MARRSWINCCVVSVAAAVVVAAAPATVVVVAATVVVVAWVVVLLEKIRNIHRQIQAVDEFIWIFTGTDIQVCQMWNSRVKRRH